VSDAAPRGSKSSPKTRAEQLADQAQEALDAAKYEEAISLLTRARDLEPGPRWTIALAKAIAASGQLLQAKKLLTDTASRSRPELQPAFDGPLAELEPRIPTLRVHVRGPAPGVATIELDGETRDEITYGGTVQLDPGSHEVKVSAPGFETATEKFELAESSAQELTVTLALELEDTSSEDFVPAPATSAWKRPVMTGSFVAAGVGIVAGTAFLIRRNGKIGEANELFDQCDPRVCSPDERARIQSLDDQGTTAATIAIASYSVAAIAAGLGVALWLNEKPTNASNDAGVSFVLQPGMGVLKGRF
jgi:hypothetical protein